jgi:hypothetical protein
MRLGRAAGIAVLVALLGGAAGLAMAESEDGEEPFAAQLGDLEGESMWDMLTPEERAAVERSGVDWVSGDQPAPAAQADAKGGMGEKLDKAGKVGFSLLAVGLSLAAAAAPFLLF